MLDASDYQTRDQTYIIFAIDEVEGVPADTQHEWFLDWCRQRNLGVKVLSGKWQGKWERSYIMRSDVEAQLWHSWCKRQEAILFLTSIVPGHGRQARLHYADGRKEAIGEWKRVDSATVADREAVTLDPSSGTYWVAA